MSKYRVLAHPDTSIDCYLDSTEYDTVDEAVKNGMSLVCSDDFAVVTVVEWKAVEAKDGE